MKQLTVTDKEAGQRLDKLLAKYLNQAGKGFIYKMIRKKKYYPERKAVRRLGKAGGGR